MVEQVVWASRQLSRWEQALFLEVSLASVREISLESVRAVASAGDWV
jgi:hypothetical protein